LDAQIQADALTAAAKREVEELRSQRDSISSYLEEMRGVLGSAAAFVTGMPASVTQPQLSANSSYSSDSADLAESADSSESAASAASADK